MKSEEIKQAEEFIRELQELGRELSSAAWLLNDIKQGVDVHVYTSGRGSDYNKIVGDGSEELKKAICSYLDAKCDKLAFKMASASMSLGPCDMGKFIQSLPASIPDWKAKENADAI